ncbi:SDR family NAD(P)-dependent oxidoreductase [Acinetobacter sp. WU_MDCI_Axc73]|nr:SDR family NAD(P)-dependent oxidoreductase [Acinetobacter sp. WU_MDCI_Axc73]
MSQFKSEQQSPHAILIGVDLEGLANAYSQRYRSDSLFCVVHQAHIDQPMIKNIHGQHYIYVDLLDKKALRCAFDLIQKTVERIELVIFQPASPVNSDLKALTSHDMQQLWQQSGLAAIHVAQNTIQKMLKKSQGTLIFLTSAEQPDAAHSSPAHRMMSVGIRALSQSLAREFQPKGLHIVNFELAQWSTEGNDVATAIVEMCQHIYLQPQSTWVQQLTA